MLHNRSGLHIGFNQQQVAMIERVRVITVIERQLCGMQAQREPEG
ncbi:Uncharacterised protein [Vibrio cholerae]|nr:Uncharacterised protein [Vibrio cholerae]CSB65567.1 Uncharacterised protein [Vibrio cholerae]CSI36355.1 Uncharacterised protein [Vibrio cholerae]